MLCCYLRFGIIYTGVGIMKIGEYKATIYDDVWRTIVHDFPNLLIAFVNELFSESYSNDARVEFLQDTHEQKMPDGTVEKCITDTCFVSLTGMALPRSIIWSARARRTAACW